MWLHKTILAIAVWILPSIGRTQEVTIEVVDPGDELVLELLEDRVYQFPADPEAGFHFPYYLFVPASLDPDGTFHLLVEPNNTGNVDDDLAVHDESARRLASRSYVTNLAQKLGTPLLVPVFPRPRSHWQTYVHALDEDTLTTQVDGLRRVDLQLLAMIESARELCWDNGLEVEEQVFMHGFSASGTFTNRFTVLHPKVVRAVASGGVNSIPISPRSEWNDISLPYPVGVADLEQLVGHAFDAAGYAQVSQFIYMGAHDRNDATLFGDSFTEEHAELVHTHLGRAMPERWATMQEVYASVDTSAQLVTYESTGHTIRPEMIDDLVKFFQANSGEERRTITPFEFPAMEFQEHEVVHIHAVYWRGDERIPEFTRQLFDGHGSFVICIEEWFPTQDHQQLDAFRSKAGFHFELRPAEGPPIEFSSSEFMGTCSLSTGEFQGYVVRLTDEQQTLLQPNTDYAIVPLAERADFWKARESAVLHTPD